MVMPHQMVVSSKENMTLASAAWMVMPHQMVVSSKENMTLASAAWMVMPHQMVASSKENMTLASVQVATLILGMNLIFWKGMHVR